MRTGVFFCQIDNSRNLNIDAIAKYSANLPDVETVQILGVKPHPDVKMLSGQIKSDKLERIVIAGDMPGYFKPVFTKAMAMT
jgi:heterodisulfide reductase subunit A-like polyferredoxin